MVDIRDVVSAYIRCIEADLDIAGVYNILEENYTIGRLAEEVRDALISCGYVM